MVLSSLLSDSWPAAIRISLPCRSKVFATVCFTGLESRTCGQRAPMISPMHRCQTLRHSRRQHLTQVTDLVSLFSVFSLQNPRNEASRLGLPTLPCRPKAAPADLDCLTGAPP